jgi:NADH:ubiquinone oxidoreductase subunit F (NADH-binding)
MIGEKKILLKNAGRINPSKITDYLSAGGYRSAVKALGMLPSDIIEIITKAGLRGRGGAGFSTGLKLKYTYNSQGSSSIRYLICNADEGEPGTFKDRYLMENDPHLLIEGMIIAAHAINAGKAYIYLRGEYFRSADLIANAIEEATDRGYLGTNIFGTAKSLSVEIKPGAGSYLCGEELTLIESAEGKRGYPRIKPPFPAEKGLFGDPTLVNNVETLANLPVIIEKGAEWYLSTGMKGSPGTKLITLSGDVAVKGCYEVEFGMTLREIIFDLAGGMENSKKFKAALIGGAAGTFVNESALDTKLGYESLREAGAVLGSGAIIVMNEERDIRKMILSILRFFSHESCGKCVPCRVGNKVLSDGLDELISSGGTKGFGLDRLLMEAEYMMKTSLCPLGQSPVIPLQSLKRYFEDEFRFDKQVR